MAMLGHHTHRPISAISIIFPPLPSPLPPPPHFYCFPSTITTTFLLFSPHHLISIFFPSLRPPSSRWLI